MATHLDLGLRCIKYLLCAVNFLFVLTGSMIFSVGTTIYAVYNDFSLFLDSIYCSPATLLIIVGVCICVIAFLGFYGALKESTCMVLVFAASLSIVLVLEMAAAISAFALQDNINGVLASKINETMQQYESNQEARNALDFLQSRLQCCGYNDLNDWENVIGVNNTTIGIPNSCCDYIIPSRLSNDTECSGHYATGCISRLTLIVNRSALYLASGAIAIAIIQFTGIMFACTLGRAIRRHKTEREIRRWELRDNLLNSYEPIGKANPLSAYPIVFMQSDNYSDLQQKIS